MIHEFMYRVNLYRYYIY